MKKSKTKNTIIEAEIDFDLMRRELLTVGNFVFGMAQVIHEAKLNEHRKIKSPRKYFIPYHKFNQITDLIDDRMCDYDYLSISEKKDRCQILGDEIQQLTDFLEIGKKE